MFLSDVTVTLFLFLFELSRGTTILLLHQEAIASFRSQLLVMTSFSSPFHTKEEHDMKRHFSDWAAVGRRRQPALINFSGVAENMVQLHSCC